MFNVNIAQIIEALGVLLIPIILWLWKLKKDNNKTMIELCKDFKDMNIKINEINTANEQYRQEIQVLKNQKIKDDADEKLEEFKYESLIKEVKKIGDKFDELSKEFNLMQTDIRVIKNKLNINGASK